MVWQVALFLRFLFQIFICSRFYHSYNFINNSKFKNMEILHSLYQQRLNSLANSFLNLLQQLQKTISPFSESQLAHHKIDYLKHIITVTLESDRQKFIKQLFEEIEDLKGRLAHQASSLCELPFAYSKELSRNSTCSRESEQYRDSVDRKYQSNGFQSSKKSISRNPNSLEQTYFDNDASMCESTVTSVLKKKGVGCRSQTSLNMENELRSRLDFESKKEQKFEFKYSRMPKC